MSERHSTKGCGFSVINYYKNRKIPFIPNMILNILDTKWLSLKFYLFVLEIIFNIESLNIDITKKY